VATPTLAFARQYKRRIAELSQVFPPEDNPGSVYPPEEAEEFLQKKFAPAPEFHRHISQRLWGLLNGLDGNGSVLNEKVLRRSQRGHLIWIPTTLVDGKNSPNSLFIENPPGTGKSLVLGAVMQACREELDATLAPGDASEKIVFCTAKAQHLPGKVRGADMGLRHVLHLPPFDMTDKEAASMHTKISKLEAPVKTLFARMDWQELMQEGMHDLKDAWKIVRRAMKEHGGVSDEVAEVLVQLLARRGVLITGPDKTPELLPLTPPTGELSAEGFTGDAAYAIPKNYPVHAKGTISKEEASLEDARIALMPIGAFVSSMSFEKMSQSFLRHVRVVLCDEAQRRDPMIFQGRVLESGARQTPLVIAAGSRWYGKNWERLSPAHSYLESIREGHLNDFGVRVFPGEKLKHYPAESQEALEQLLEEHLRTLPLFEQLDLPQPGKNNTLLVVHTKLIAHAVKMFREVYAKRKDKKDAQVFGYNGSADAPEALQAWFGQPGDKLFIVPASILKEAWDFPRIRQLLIGTKVTPDVLFHLIGRLAHGQGKKNKRDRLLVSLQQFIDSNFSSTPFHQLAHGQTFDENGFQWVPGQALMSANAFELDQKMVRGQEHKLGAAKVPPEGHHGSDAVTKSYGQMLVARGGNDAVEPVTVQYDPSKGPPGVSDIYQWAFMAGGEGIYSTYNSSINLVAADAYRNGQDPQKAVQRKIAQLRERHGRVNGGGQRAEQQQKPSQNVAVEKAKTVANKKKPMSIDKLDMQLFELFGRDN